MTTRPSQNSDHIYAGKRFRLLSMTDDPNPIPNGAIGTVDSAVDFPDHVHLNVTWDPPHSHRHLNVLYGKDVIEWLPDEDTPYSGK